MHIWSESLTLVFVLHDHVWLLNVSTEIKLASVITVKAEFTCQSLRACRSVYVARAAWTQIYFPRVMLLQTASGLKTTSFKWSLINIRVIISTWIKLSRSSVSCSVFSCFTERHFFILKYQFQLHLKVYFITFGKHRLTLSLSHPYNWQKKSRVTLD